LDDNRVIDAQVIKGVCIRENIADRMSKRIVDVFEVNTTSEQDEIIKDFLTRQIGKKYDYLALIGFVLHTTKESRKQLSRWICSELVFAAFQKANINLLDRIDAWKVSPTILSYSTIMVPKGTLTI
jgi:uncharacterized protein YycO